MKTTVVPAQITTVEDRIAGNFTFAQIFLMIIALIVGTLLYVFIPPRMHLGSIKLVLITLQFIIFGGLAFRINGKIVAEWLKIYSHYSKRPRRYVFTKNDEAGRYKPISLKIKESFIEQPLRKKRVAIPGLAPSEESQLGRLLHNPTVTVSFELAKKGGIDVSLTPLKD